MTFSFRVRFHLAPGVRIGGPDEVWVLEDGPAERVELRPCNGSTPIAEAEEFSLRGWNYPDKDTAVVAASRWSDRIRAVFAANYIPADFGDRAAKGFVTEHARSKLSEKAGVPVLSDVHGVMVFQTDPRPVLIRVGGVKGTVHKSADKIQACFEATKTVEITTSDANVLAFDLFSAASFETSPDTRLILYVTAVEALASREVRPTAAVDALEAMMDRVSEIDVDNDTKNSLRSGLRELQQESIGQACRRLVRSLSEKQYLEVPADKFFSRCYTLRSELVHGAFPRPEVDEVRRCGGGLQRLVGDLLAGADLRNLVSEYVPPSK